MVKILVIDDSPMMSDYLRRCLDKADIEVEQWLPMSPMEIPDKLLTSAPNLILTDYQMPGCNGASVARTVHKTNPDIPVVVLTAFYDKDTEANLLKFGVKQIIYKPIRCEELVKVVKGYL